MARNNDDTLMVVQKAREAAEAAMAGLRADIEATKARLDQLTQAEGALKLTVGVVGGSQTAARRGPGRPRRTNGKAPGRKRTPIGQKAYEKLPDAFSVEDVRKAMTRRLAGVSLAQMVRRRMVAKQADGTFRKVANAQA